MGVRESVTVTLELCACGEADGEVVPVPVPVELERATVRAALAEGGALRTTAKRGKSWRYRCRTGSGAPERSERSYPAKAEVVVTERGCEWSGARPAEPGLAVRRAATPNGHTIANSSSNTAHSGVHRRTHRYRGYVHMFLRKR